MTFAQFLWYTDLAVVALVLIGMVAVCFEGVGQ
jgi:hypothetical protein